MNKKGVMWSDIKNAVLTALGIGIGIYLIWAYVLHGGGDAANSLQKCGSVTGSAGSCKETCDSTTELTFENVGCDGVKNKCCVPKTENMDDVILPSGYGGSKEYDFTVNKIEFGLLPEGCSPKQNDITKTIVCRPSGRYDIPVIITVTNTNKAVEVYADPIVVVNDNGDKIKGTGTYTGTTAVKLTEKGETKEVTTNIEIGPSESKDNDYWEVFPYARCITRECRKTDLSGSNGIMSMNENDWVTIEFFIQTT